MTDGIRRATSTDLAQVRALVEAAYSPWIERIGMRPGPMDDDYEHHIAEGRVWVREAPGAMVGLVILVDEGDALLLDNVAVHPGHHGSGHGRALLDFAEAFAREAGCRTIRLYTHERMAENIDIYARRGFVETHRAQEHGFRRVFMAKQLPRP